MQVAVGVQVAVGTLQAAGGTWEQRRGSATPQGLKASRVASWYA